MNDREQKQKVLIAVRKARIATEKRKINFSAREKILLAKATLLKIEDRLRNFFNKITGSSFF